jgi:hypothetical protein
MLRRVLVAVSAAALLSVGFAGPALAGQPSGVGNPNGTGQPNQSCGSITAPTTPGQSFFAPGSAFNPKGQAGSVYAGQQTQNSQNPNSVSQYDVACYQTSN